MEHLRVSKFTDLDGFSEMRREELKTSQRAGGAGGPCHISF